MTTTFSPIFFHNSKYECVTRKRGIDALHSPSGVPDGSLKNARRNRTGTLGSMVFAIWCSEVPGESKKNPCILWIYFLMGGTQQSEYGTKKDKMLQRLGTSGCKSVPRVPQQGRRLCSQVILQFVPPPRVTTRCGADYCG